MEDKIYLSKEDQERLAEMLSNPPELNEAMLRAKEYHEQLISDESHQGSSFKEWLKEEGILEEVEAEARLRVENWKLTYGEEDE